MVVSAIQVFEPLAPPQRRGVTLVEVLMVVSIVGILVSLTAPALQQAREQSRILGCQSNLRQIALAGVQFEAAQRRFPVGINGYPNEPNCIRWNSDSDQYSWRRRSYVSSLFFLLPMLESQALFDSCDPIAGRIGVDLREFGFDSAIDIPGLRILAGQEISVFRCPTDQRVIETSEALFQPCEHPTGHATDYFLTASIGLNQSVARTNYGGCHRAVSTVDYFGPIDRGQYGMMGMGERIGTEKIKDGLSKTVFFGEMIGRVRNNEDQRTTSWLLFAMAYGTGPASWPTGRRVDGYEFHPILGNTTNSTGHGFGSAHYDVVNFAFGDGHTERMSRDIDLHVIVAICGRANGG